MKTSNRVAWTEGMFLKTQHFQQADRWVAATLRERTAHLVPYPWGVVDLQVDEAGLGIGRFALSRVRAVMADGTVIAAPEECDLPPPLALREGTQERIVHLALPAQRPGAPEFAPLDGADGARAVRYRREEIDADDANADTSFGSAIEIGRLALSLVVEGEETAGLETLPLARVAEVRADLAVVLDETVMPPAMTLAASPRLSGYVTEIAGLLRHRAEALARRAGDPALRGAAEIGDYLMLQAINRSLPLMEHLGTQTAQIHPEAAYRALIALAGELRTFTDESRLPARLPPYRHLDPKGTFDPVMGDLRRSLSSVLDRSAILVALEERRHGVRVGMLADAGLRRDATMVLAARSEMQPERLRRLLPTQIKVGPVERIAELVNVALPGVEVRPMAVAPRQLPFRQGTVYFELDTRGELWGDVASTGTVALHLATEFPGLDMELWGIRS
jgi:type VI secretion system protein ImpJ